MGQNLACENEYIMTHMSPGQFVVINNRNFKEHDLNERKGTDEDAKNLVRCFKDLGFETFMFQNQTAEEMQEVMQKGIVAILNIVVLVDNKVCMFNHAYPRED